MPHRQGLKVHLNICGGAYDIRNRKYGDANARNIHGRNICDENNILRDFHGVT